MAPKNWVVYTAAAAAVAVVAVVAYVLLSPGDQDEGDSAESLVAREQQEQQQAKARQGSKASTAVKKSESSAGSKAGPFGGAGGGGSGGGVLTRDSLINLLTDMKAAYIKADVRGAGGKALGLFFVLLPSEGGAPGAFPRALLLAHRTLNLHPLRTLTLTPHPPTPQHALLNAHWARVFSIHPPRRSP